jgi:hypothetical protein
VGHSKIVESKASWFEELARELKTRRLVLAGVGAAGVVFLLGLLVWLFVYSDPPAESDQVNEVLSSGQHQAVAEIAGMERGQRFHIFTQVAHPLGEDVVTAHMYRAPDLENPFDQYCYLAVNQKQISRFARDRSGVYDRSTNEELLQYEDGCRYKE